MSRPIPVVGMKLIDRQSRHRSNSELVEVEVKRVGRKYFWTGELDKGEWSWIKFELDGWREVSEYSSNHSLYESKQEVLDEQESIKLAAEIREAFGGFGRCGYSLETLRKIKELLQ